MKHYITLLIALFVFGTSSGYEITYNEGTDNEYRLSYEIIDDNAVKAIYYASNYEKEKDFIIPQTVTIEGKNYTVIRIEGTFKYSKPKSIVLPPTIQYVEGGIFRDCTVLESFRFDGAVDHIVQFDSEAFYNCTSLTSIELPSIDCIPENMFYGCVSLVSVKLGDKSFTDAGRPYFDPEIGKNAFYNCVSLSELNIPAKYQAIGVNAFLNCRSIKSFTIPASVMLREGVFSGCTGITEFKVEGTEKRNFTRDGVLYSYQKYIPIIEGDDVLDYPALIAYPAGKDSKSFTMPDDINIVGARAFDGASNLESITLGENVTELGVLAFNNCTGLKEVTLPSSIGFLPHGTFSGCKSLAKVNLPSSYTYLGASSFEGCESMAAIDIPSSVKIIGGSTFANCKSLKSVTLPEAVKSVESYTFSSCEALESVTLPSALTEIQAGAFKGCASLAEVALPESLTLIDDWAFKECTSLESFKIPDGVTSVGSKAFEGCLSLKSIDIGDGVKTLGDWSFYNCQELQSLRLGKSLERIGTEAFDGDNKITQIICRSVTPPDYPTGFSQDVINNATLTVPDGSEDGYYANSTWNPILGQSGIHDITADENVEDYITIDGSTLKAYAPSQLIDVYSISGTCLGKATGELTLNLTPGIYIVRIGVKTSKIKM